MQRNKKRVGLRGHGISVTGLSALALILGCSVDAGDDDTMPSTSAGAAGVGASPAGAAGMPVAVAGSSSVGGAGGAPVVNSGGMGGSAAPSAGSNPGGSGNVA